MTLDADELTDIRGDIGDTNNAFSDAELQRLHVRSGGVYPQTVLLAIDQLLANAAKFSDYTQNETQERKSQVFKNLLDMRDIWVKRANKGAAALRIVKIAPQSHDKDEPWGENWTNNA